MVLDTKFSLNCKYLCSLLTFKGNLLPSKMYIHYYLEQHWVKETSGKIYHHIGYVMRSRLHRLLGLHRCIHAFNISMVRIKILYHLHTQSLLHQKLTYALIHSRKHDLSDTLFWQTLSFGPFRLSFSYSFFHLLPDSRTSRASRLQNVVLTHLSSQLTVKLLGWWLMVSRWGQVGFEIGNWRRFDKMECHGQKK